MTISMNAENNKKVRPGVALLVVLFIVMAITILSLGFVTRSDIELACGQNMLLRTQMDYLAESGLEHARGLILNPQDVSSEYEYFMDATAQQLVGDSRDYYDLKVVLDDSDPTNRCNYIIDCNAYRLEGGEKIGRSDIRATLRLDPCIAYWVGSNTTVWPQITVNGDVYCGGTLTNNSAINGDVFAVETISETGTTTGRKNESVTPSYPVTWPSLVIASFEPIMEVNIPQNIPPGSFDGICYSAVDVNIPGNVTINGTLVVNGDLTISGLNNVITAGKNFPALVVGGQVLMKDSSSLEINGLAQIAGPVTFDPSATSSSIQVIGGLFINSGGIEEITSGSVIITAAPEKASIEIWADGTAERWSPAAGAFFKSITRPPAE